MPADFATPTPEFSLRGFRFRLAPDETGRLGLSCLDLPGYAPVVADWLDPDTRRRVRAGKDQLLGRALAVRRLDGAILDATAGLGRDGFVLACLGLPVTLCERVAATAALLLDAQHRAARAADPRVAQAAGRLRVVAADAIELLSRAEGDPLVRAAGGPWTGVLIDPMYPSPPGRTALPSREMQVLRRLAGDDPDASLLLAAARRHPGVRRIAVKRPGRAAPLGGLSPVSAVEGTQARFDIYGPGLDQGAAVGDVAPPGHDPHDRYREHHPAPAEAPPKE